MSLIDDLREFALGQGGAISTAQCRRLGATPSDLCRLVATHELQHPFRGAYTLPGDDEMSAEDQHLLLCRAGLLIYPEGVLGGVSACLALGLPSTGADLSQPVIHRGKHRGVGVRGVRLRRQRGLEPTDTPTGPVLPAATAVIDHARDHGTIPGVVTADAAIHRGLVTQEALTAALAPVRNWPGGALAAAALAFADGRSESPGESWTRVQLAMAGIETVPQVQIRDASGAFVARVDLLVAGTKTIIEFDGRVKYADGDPDVLWAEKRREDRLRRLGYTVVRVTWADLHRPGLVAALVRRAMAA